MDVSQAEKKNDRDAKRNKNKISIGVENREFIAF